MLCLVNNAMSLLLSRQTGAIDYQAEMIAPDLHLLARATSLYKNAMPFDGSGSDDESSSSSTHVSG